MVTKLKDGLLTNGFSTINKRNYIGHSFQHVEDKINELVIIVNNMYEGYSRDRINKSVTTLNTIHNKYSKDEMLLNMQYYMEYCNNNEYVTPEVWIERYKHFDI